MNISITGTLGSGKSSVCKILKENGYDIISNGVLFRQIAEEKGISVVELNELAKKDKSIDDMLDERSIRLGKELDQTVFDSRMGWHFIPHSFKVFLLADMREAGRRVFNDNRVSEEYASQEEATQNLIQRQLMEKKRFFDLYQVDYLNLNNYNLVIESTHASPEEVAEKILEGARDFARKKRALINTESLHVIVHAEEEGPVRVGVARNKFYLLSGLKEFLVAKEEGRTFIEATLDEDNRLWVDSSEELILDFVKR
ncbi:MAG: dephospho-CoA kinase [Eubacterium sp.]|nr:dephospho-CoA kinase [Eubacterium sp.]